MCWSIWPGCVQIGHDHGGTKSVARHVTNGKGDAPVLQAPHVAVVAAHPHGRLVAEGNVHARDTFDPTRHQPDLDLPREFNLLIQNPSFRIGLCQEQALARKVDLPRCGLDEVQEIRTGLV